MNTSLSKNIFTQKNITSFIIFSLVIISTSFFFFFLAVKDAEAKKIVRINTHRPCRNIVYDDGSHCSWARCGPKPPQPPPPPPPDQCTNIVGYQYPVPSGFTRDSNGICKLNGSAGIRVSCKAVPNPVKVGDSFNFIASTVYSSGDVTYSWYEGSSTGGSPSYTQTSKSSSSYKKSYSKEGNMQVAVTARDSSGRSSSSICGVTVRNSDDSDSKSDGKELEGGKMKGSDSAPLPVLEFELDKELTNKTCIATWNASNVIQCFIVNDKGVETEVDFSGTQDVGGGKWSLSCVSERLKDGAAYIVQSDERLCRLNIDVREK